MTAKDDATDKRNSFEWSIHLRKDVRVHDPDGWDRKNFYYSWYEEPITKQEFERRFLLSTVSVPDFGKGIWSDEKGNDMAAPKPVANTGVANPPEVGAMTGELELREAIIAAIHEYAVACTIYNANEFKFVTQAADKIIALFDPQKANLIAAIRSEIPALNDKAYYTKHPVLWKPVAPESNAEHYDAGFNQALENVRTILDSIEGSNHDY